MMRPVNTCHTLQLDTSTVDTARYIVEYYWNILIHVVKLVTRAMAFADTPSTCDAAASASWETAVTYCGLPKLPSSRQMRIDHLDPFRSIMGYLWIFGKVHGGSQIQNVWEVMRREKSSAARFLQLFMAWECLSHVDKNRYNMDSTALLALPYDLVASVWANLDVIGFFVVARYSCRCYRMFDNQFHYVCFTMFRLFYFLLRCWDGLGWIPALPSFAIVGLKKEECDFKIWATEVLTILLVVGLLDRCFSLWFDFMVVFPCLKSASFVKNAAEVRNRQLGDILCLSTNGRGCSNVFNTEPKASAMAIWMLLPCPRFHLMPWHPPAT